MKICITGCAGFIGSHLSEHFIGKGATVIGIDNLSRKGSNENLNLLQKSSNSNFIFNRIDIRDFEKIKKVFIEQGPFDLIIHEAGQVAVTSSLLNPREDFEINALGTFNLLEATRLYSPEAFFEYASTNKVYGAMDQVDIVEKNNEYAYSDELINGVNESHPIDFHSPYGCSKGAADQYVRDYARIYGMDTVVFRQSCIYGTKQFGIEDQGWVAWFVIASILNKKITIYGDGKQCRDILWIDDLVECYELAYTKRTITAGKIYNIGGGMNNVLSIQGLIGVLKESGVMINEPAYDDWRDGDQKVFICDVAKIETDTGWKPRISTFQGVQKLIEWSRKNKEVLSKILG